MQMTPYVLSQKPFRESSRTLADAGICFDWFEANMTLANPGKLQYMVTGSHDTWLALHDVVLDQEHKSYSNFIHVNKV